ncbi:hypothetical protein VPH35_107945 [Triticum aestivum]
MKNRKQVFYLHEQVGFCKASPEPFQLFQSHKMIWKSVQGSRGTRTPTVRSSLPSRGLGQTQHLPRASINTVSRRVVPIRDDELLS